MLHFYDDLNLAICAISEYFRDYSQEILVRRYLFRNYFAWLYLFNISKKYFIFQEIVSLGTFFFRRFSSPSCKYSKERKGLWDIRLTHLLLTCLNCHARLFADIGLGRRPSSSTTYVFECTMIYKSDSVNDFKRPGKKCRRKRNPRQVDIIERRYRRRCRTVRIKTCT